MKLRNIEKIIFVNINYIFLIKNDNPKNIAVRITFNIYIKFSLLSELIEVILIFASAFNQLHYVVLVGVYEENLASK